MKNQEHSFNVDFVAEGSAGEWIMVLVEQGPWHNLEEQELYRIQTRLYDCLEAALDGQVAHRFPESKGKSIKIRLDCYDLPKEKISLFFLRFTNGVLDTPDYISATVGNKWVKDISFEINFDTNA